MLTRFFKGMSQWISWLAVVLDSSHKLFPGRLARIIHQPEKSTG